MSNNMKKVLVFLSVFLLGGLLAIIWHIRADIGTYPVYPVVSTQIEREGEYIRLDVAEGGSYKKSHASGAIREADFRILASWDSISAQQENVVTVDENGNMVKFSVDFDGTLSGVQVLRWPISLYGCGKALDVAERIPYTQKGNERQFECEKGYLYSIYITWDEYFVEYVFRTE